MVDLRQSSRVLWGLLDLTKAITSLIDQLGHEVDDDKASTVVSSDNASVKRAQLDSIITRPVGMKPPDHTRQQTGCWAKVCQMGVWLVGWWPHRGKCHCERGPGQSGKVYFASKG